MTDHRRQETSFASEESSFWPPSGSFVFCHPREVLHWQESVPHPVDTSQPQSFYPSPPETECFQDYQDIMSQHSQTSVPGEWPAVSSPENGQCYQLGWQGQGAPVTSQRIAALDTATFLSVPSSTVSSVLSPVLSHESQSHDTLTSFSEPDLCELPSALDLSFTNEPAWNYSSPVQYSADVPTSVSGFGFTPLSEHNPYSAGYSMAPATAMLPGIHGPVFYPQGGQVALQKRSASYPHAAPMRPIRPRADGSTASSQSIHGQQQAQRPQMPASHGSQHTISSVSSSSGHSHNGHTHYFSYGSAGLEQTPVSGPLASFGQTGYGAPASLVSDPTDEDFGAFLNYDHEDHIGSAAALSFPSAYALQGAIPSGVQEDIKPVVAVTQQERKAISPGSSVPASHTSENDEGRHRTHPLYSEGPRSDGLYHCPYKAKDPNCPHKPTKLKCNYDKFIDSHLKPFRCKVESCAKQEFSSTACLLRHEREAHGMHGHGERPHLCHYSGCERSAPGNGFPRRYNLFDHMKRVHDHKEDLVDQSGGPFTATDGQKKTGRKRKPSNSPPAPAPAAQRPKAMSVTSQQVPAMYYPVAGYGPQSIYDASQWTTQDSLMAKQMDFIQEHNAELRRLSVYTQRR